MKILVTRSLQLSNTLFSLLLENEGKFLTLGREWIGSLEKDKRNSVCYSELFAKKDPYYTDPYGTYRQECGYFINGIINNDRLFIQNYIFDEILEVKFLLG